MGDLGATYDDHLRHIGKRVVDFLLALIELFSLGVTAEDYERLSVENRRFPSNGGQLTQNFRSKGSPLTNHSSSLLIFHMVYKSGQIFLPFCHNSRM